MLTSTCHGWEIQRSPCLDDIFPIPLFSCNYAALLVIQCWSANIVLIGQPPIGIVGLDLNILQSPRFHLSALLHCEHSTATSCLLLPCSMISLLAFRKKKVRSPRGVSENSMIPLPPRNQHGKWGEVLLSRCRVEMTYQNDEQSFLKLIALAKRNKYGIETIGLAKTTPLYLSSQAS